MHSPGAPVPVRGPPDGRQVSSLTAKWVHLQFPLLRGGHAPRDASDERQAGRRRLRGAFHRPRARRAAPEGRSAQADDRAPKGRHSSRSFRPGPEVTSPASRRGRALRAPLRGSALSCPGREPALRRPLRLGRSGPAGSLQGHAAESPDAPALGSKHFATLRENLGLPSAGTGSRCEGRLVRIARPSVSEEPWPKQLTTAGPAWRPRDRKRRGTGSAAAGVTCVARWSGVEEAPRLRRPPAVSRRRRPSWPRRARARAPGPLQRLGRLWAFGVRVYCRDLAAPGVDTFTPEALLARWASAPASRPSQEAPVCCRTPSGAWCGESRGRPGTRACARDRRGLGGPGRDT